MELAGRYQVLDKLGEGAMGEVYLVEHQHLGRKEALKILRPGLAASSELVSRFRREARATNRLQHPSIVAVYDFGQLPDGRFFLSTEYADGETVAARLERQGPFSPRVAVGLLLQVADSIHHAHARGVIHRDLKPANMILVPRRGGMGDLVKVLDFGVAKIIAPDYQDSLLGTDPTSVFGTPAYMSPEQVEGNGSEPRIDIYAFGCVAHELLTGEPPFVGGWVDVLHAQLETPPPRVRDARPDVSEELEAVILRCLDKQADGRFQTGREIRDALEQVPELAIASGGRRRSARNIPRLSQEAEADTIDKPVHTRLQTPNPLGFIDRVDTDATTAQLTRRDVEVAFQVVLRGLAEALIDAGCGDFQLTVGVAEIAGVEGEIERLEAEVDDCQRRIDALEQRRREYETSLRFAIGELRFEIQRSEARGDSVDDQVRFQLARLERQLQQVIADTDAKADELTGRAVELAADKDEREQELGRLYARLDGFVVDLSRRFADDPTIVHLVERAAALRARLQLLAEG